MAKPEFNHRRRCLTGAVTAAAWLLAPAAARVAHAAAGAAADPAFPTMPIRIIVPYAPGGLPDVMARLIASRLGATLGQSVIVDNRPGANGAIGTNLVARARPDGYTLGMVASSHVFGRALTPNLPYDPVKSFAPVTMAARTPIVIVASRALPVKTLGDMLRYARARPGELSYASAGIGSNTHIFGQWFCEIAGLKMVHIPYKGATPAHVDLISGRVALEFDTIASAQPGIAAGKLNLLAVAGDRRLPQYPEVPTVDQAGIHGFEAESWDAVLAPAGTPPAIVNRLNRAIVDALQTSEIRDRLASAGAQVAAGTPGQLLDTLVSEESRYGALIKKMNITLE